LLEKTRELHFRTSLNTFLGHALSQCELLRCGCNGEQVRDQELVTVWSGRLRKCRLIWRLGTVTAPFPRCLTCQLYSGQLFAHGALTCSSFGLCYHQPAVPFWHVELFPAMSSKGAVVPCAWSMKAYGGLEVYLGARRGELGRLTPLPPGKELHRYPLHRWVPKPVCKKWKRNKAFPSRESNRVHGLIEALLQHLAAGTDRWPFRQNNRTSWRRWTMDSLYAFKCKRFRNTRHTVTFGIPLQSSFWNTLQSSSWQIWTIMITWARTLEPWSSEFRFESRTSHYTSWVSFIVVFLGSYR
jgi:hypothetical protein